MKAMEKRSKMTANAKEEKVNALNRMVMRWREQFESPPSTPILFSVNKYEQLCLNDVVICNIFDVKEETACSDLGAFFIDSQAYPSAYYRITVNWDYGDHVSVREVALILYEGKN